MSYTFEDFRHDYALEMLDRLTPEERRRGLSDAELDRLEALLARRKSGRP